MDGRSSELKGTVPIDDCSVLKGTVPVDDDTAELQATQLQRSTMVEFEVRNFWRSTGNIFSTGQMSFNLT